MKKKIYREIIEKAMEEKPDAKGFRQLKRKITKKYKVSIPRNYDLFRNAKKQEQAALKHLLLKKPTRSISGVSVVAVMCKPHKCPHGTCDYCPKGKEAPQSYTGDEPAARRARTNKFDAYSQVKNRLDQLKNSGHPTDKIELIIMGGTFPSLPWNYQNNFVRDCLNAIISNGGRRGAGAQGRRNTLKSAQKAAETSKLRPIGITIETRPDYCKQIHIKRMLELGATRVELGVQTVYDSIFKKIHRGHTVKDVVEATRLLKNAGLKVNYHMMPGLPGSNLEKDLQAFKKIFTDEKFKPDMIKIYPTLVMEGTKLYKDWKAGKYEPLDSENAAKLITKIKKFVPDWVRIMRVQRDIPSNLIAAGVKKSNLRQLAKGKCNCIRCREIGHKLRSLGAQGLRGLDIQIRVKKYAASGGIEYFISAEDFSKGVLIGYLRLRKNRVPKSLSSQVPVWLIRELHVYGTEVALGKKAATETSMQHRGWGKKLLQESEGLAQGKLYVLSGIGAREYYRKLGYAFEAPYMVKNLRKSINKT
ncbi:MAG: tRNA uridine(34) 5-carboxymethylaminomethyl modification radical SAM/GNAT enzyme Elp3 [archaeon]